MLDTVTPTNSSSQALLQQSAALLAPFVRLLIANGVTYPQLAHVLKNVFIDEAQAALRASGRRDTDSALSLLTGVHRKEVKTRTQPASTNTLPDLSLTSQVFTRWLTDPAYHDQAGRPLPLARGGPAPSFESLAQSISKDMHPRTIQDELTRQGLVKQEGEQLSLCGSAFVPRADFSEMLSLLVDNVADHISAGANNLMNQSGPLLEQSVFADHLHQASVAQLQNLARDLWQQNFKAMVEKATQLCDIDEPRGGQQRVRFGVYFFSGSMNPRETGATTQNTLDNKEQ